MAQVTVHGGGSNVLVFNVSGSAAINYANAFSAGVGVNQNVSTLSLGHPESTVAGALNIIFSTGSPATYTLATPDQYTFVDTGDAASVDGSAHGDTVGGGADFTYVESATGGNNNVFFTVGDNTFDGSPTGGAGDTISGGSGNDTIKTGGGPSTVFGGTGNTTVYLNDTVAGDIAVMQYGNTTVFANGVSDTVSASATGEVFGGTGSLTFVAHASATPLPVTVVGGTGPTAILGDSNTDLTFVNGGASSTIVAGAGNETLNGFGSTGFNFFGDTSASDSVAYTVTGGSGTDYFSTGAGSEYFQAGTGTDSFNIASIAGGANITIADFGGADSVSFEASITNETTDGTNYTVTLSDGTSVEFLGITSLTGHIT